MKDTPKSQKGYPSRSAPFLFRRIDLHAEGADAQLLHDSSVVLATSTKEHHFLSKFLALYTGTALVEIYPIVLVDGDEDALVIFRDEWR